MAQGPEPLKANRPDGSTYPYQYAPILHPPPSGLPTRYKSEPRRGSNLRPPASKACALPEAGLAKPLFSISETMRLCGWRYIFNGTDDSSIIINNKIIPLTYAPECGLFYIRLAQQGVSLFSYTKATPDKNLWHLRLGHLGISTMDKTVKAPGITGMTFASGDVDHFCEVCASSKARAEALNRALCDIRSLNCMERLQWDLWGPLPVVSYGGTRYVSSMVCMASGVGILLNVAFKDEAYDQHLKLVITTANLYGHTIKTIRSDNDRSLVDNNSSKQIMLDNKITAELTGRDNHHRIGAAERRWQTLHSMSLSMLRHAGIGLEFMAYAIHAANYILNRVWQDNKQCIPFAKLTNVSSVDLSHLSACFWLPMLCSH